jgi:hypothetical protein
MLEKLCSSEIISVVEINGLIDEPFCLSYVQPFDRLHKQFIGIGFLCLCANSSADQLYEC